MPFNDPLFGQGLLFTGIAMSFVVASAWWLYKSPMKVHVERNAAPSPRLARWVAGLLALSAVQLVTGAFWDASMHLQTGKVVGGSDFLWPPHIVIYSSFLVSLIVATLAIGLVAIPEWNNGVRDPRIWVRRNPYLGAVALASVYMLMAIPGDALWHQLFGVDLTAWSPPHLLIGVSNATVIICALGLLVQARPKYGHALMVILSALMLNFIYLIGVLEWELPGQRSPFVDARPLWSYPLVGGAVAFFTLMLAKQLVRFRWTATATAMVFYGVRLGLSAGLAFTGNIAPFMPLWFIGGAVLIDVVDTPGASINFAHAAGTAVAFAFGYLLVALPLLSLRANLKAFNPADYVWAMMTMVLACWLLSPVARWASARLLGAQIDRAAAAARRQSAVA
jgi:hypothetical protein